MSLYEVCVTGPDMGVLEVVQNAETTGAINREAGGARQVLLSIRFDIRLISFYYSILFFRC